MAIKERRMESGPIPNVPAPGRLGYDARVSTADGRDGSERTIITERKLVTSESVGDHQAYVVVIYGEELGKRIALTDLPVEAGRSTKCHIPIDHESVSRKHAAIWWTGRGYRVKDLGSPNGTYVNDQQMTGHSLGDG